MHKALKRYFLKESETRQILTDFYKMFDVDLERVLGTKPRIELVETQETKIFIFGKVPLLAKTRNGIFPTLLFKEMFHSLSKIVVDMGAIPHICNGADLMAPGVVKIEGEFGKDDLLLIVDVRYGKPLAIGQALLDSKVMNATKRGKVVKNIHHVGDEIWNLMKEIA